MHNQTRQHKSTEGGMVLKILHPPLLFIFFSIYKYSRCLILQSAEALWFLKSAVVFAFSPFLPSVDCFKENMCPLATAAHLLYDTSNPDVWPASQLVTTLDAIDPSPGGSPPHVRCSSYCSAFFGTYLLPVFLDASCLCSSSRDEPEQQSCSFIENDRKQWRLTWLPHSCSLY